MTAGETGVDGSGVKGLRVLVAEDRGLVAAQIVLTLREAGCVTIGPAGSLASGLAMLAERGEPADAAVLDIDLRGEPVYPLAEALRARGVPIMFMTGYSVAGIPDAWRSTHRVEKPFTAEALIACLDAACRGRPVRPDAAATYFPSGPMLRANETMRATRDTVTEFRIIRERSRGGRAE